MNMRSKTNVETRQETQGFTLIEMMIVMSVILILAAMSVPRMMIAISDISLRYSAMDFIGLVQSARIQAVRKNTFYTVQLGTLPSGDAAYYVDLPKAGNYVNGDPMLPTSANLNVHLGPGSGAPNETAFLAGRNFVVDNTGSPPSFSARGLPCIATPASCPMVPGQGFVVFISKAAVFGNVPWVAVVINPSGHTQLWTSDTNGNWVQRD